MKKNEEYGLEQKKRIYILPAAGGIGKRIYILLAMKLVYILLLCAQPSLNKFTDDFD